MDSPPITLLYWLIAALPLVILLVLLVGFDWKAGQAASAGFFLAAALALVFFRTDALTLAVATGKGTWDAVFILLVVWPALLLYEVSQQAGAFEVFRQELEAYTRSRLLLVLAFGWVFASFLQGIAGFGAPIAIVAPLLVGLGVRPVMAVAIPLIGHAWANLFGTLAVAWLATLQVIDLQNQSSTALLTALQLWIPNLLAGLAIAWLYGRWKALARGWPIILAVTLIHGGGQLALAGLNPIVSNFIPSTLAIGVILAIERLPRFHDADPLPSRIFEEEQAEDAEDEKAAPDYSVHVAMTPYYALIAASLFVLVIPQVNEFLGRVSVGFPFPEVRTGFGVTQDAEQAYGAIEILTHPGLLLLLAAVVGYAVFKSRGHLAEGAERKILAGTAGNSLPASIAVLGFLILSKMMDHAGMTNVLAEGIAAISPPVVYAFLASFIGLLGSFMTSSNTASNILFAPLQQQTAQATALTEANVIAAQHAGGAIGNAVSPANVVLGTGTAKIPGQEGEVLKITLPFALIAAGLVGVLSILLFLLQG